MVLVELQTFLAAAGLGLTADTNLFYGILPDTPDVCATINLYPGRPIEPNLGSGGGGVRLEYPRIQVVCRGTVDNLTAPTLLATQIMAALTGIVNQTLSGVFYLAVEAQQTPFPMRRDDNHRVEVACNYQVTKGYSAT